MWIFEEDVSPEEAVEFANEGGGEAICKFTDKSLENKDVLFALCEAGYVTEVISYASKNLFEEIEFIKKISNYVIFDNDKNKIVDKVSKKIKEEVLTLLNISNIKEEKVDILKEKEDLFNTLSTFDMKSTRKII